MSSGNLYLLETPLLTEEENLPNEVFGDGKNMLLSVPESSIPKQRKRNKQYTSSATSKEVKKRKLFKAKRFKKEIIRKYKVKFINEKFQRIEENFTTNFFKDFLA